MAPPKKPPPENEPEEIPASEDLEGRLNALAGEFTALRDKVEGLRLGAGTETLSDQNIARLAGQLWGDPRVQEFLGTLNAAVVVYEQKLKVLEERVRTHFRDHHKYVEADWKW